MTKPPRPSPLPPPSRRTRAFAKTRWLYTQDGRDVGPFTPSEVEQLILAEELAEDTPIREIGQRRMHKLHEVRAFRAALKTAANQREKRRKEKEMDRVETAVRTKRRTPIVALAMGAVLILGSIGVLGWQWMQSRHSYPASDYTRAILFADLSLTSVPNRAYVTKNARIEWADESVRWHKNKTRRKQKRSGSRHTGLTASANDLGPVKNDSNVEEISFLGGGGRELSASEVNRVMRNVTPQLIHCAQKQANRQAKFPGTTVRFALLKTGGAGKIQIGKNGRRSRAFVQCVRAAVGRVRVEPFTGHGRVISIPLKVGR